MIEGFQLWVNLPAADKMMEPRYQGVTDEEIPLVLADDGIAIRVIAGMVDGVTGPVCGIVTDPEYLDVTLPPTTRFEHPTMPGHTVFAYVIAGSAEFAEDADAEARASDAQVVLFGDGDPVVARTAEQPGRFLLCSARPLHEPVAWGGPIVMNTQAELEAAFDELERGTFIREGADKR